MASRNRKKNLSNSESTAYSNPLGIPNLLRMPIITMNSLPIKSFGEVSKTTLDAIKVNASNTIKDIEFKNFVEEIKYRIYMIIDSITEKVAIDNVLTMAQTIQSKIKEKDDIVQLVKLMETTTMSIIQNITNKVSLDVILTRIQFIKQLLEESQNMDMSFLPVYDSQICALITEMIASVTSRGDINIIVDYVKNTKEYIQKYVAVIGPLPERNAIIVQTLNKAETLVISIIQNIIDKASLDVILGRTKYLKTIIDGVKNI
jgi:hypothetical protein